MRTAVARIESGCSGATVGMGPLACSMLSSSAISSAASTCSAGPMRSSARRTSDGSHGESAPSSSSGPFAW